MPQATQKFTFPLRSHPVIFWGGVIIFLLTVISLNVIVLSRLPQKEVRSDNQAASADVESKAQSVVTTCKEEDKWNICYPLMFQKLASQYDLELTTKILKKIISKDGRINSCHVIAHEIMSEEVKKHPDKWRELLAIADPNLCNYGFIHGIIEGRAAMDPGFRLDEKSIASFCTAMGDQKGIQGVEQGCAHIMGHMLLLQTKGDVEQGFRVCAKTAETLQVQCAAGVTMESFTRTNLVEHGLGKYIPWNDETISSIESLCRKQTGTIAYGCWEMLSNLYNNRTPNDQAAVLAQCKKAPNETLQQGCYAYSVATLVQNPNATRSYFSSLCNEFSGSGFSSQCIFTAVKGLMNSTIVPSRTAIMYCESLSSQKKECFADINRLLSMRDYSQKEFTDYCSSARAENRNLCMGNSQ